MCTCTTYPFQDGSESKAEFDSKDGKARDTHSPPHPTGLPPSRSKPPTLDTPATTHAPPTLPRSPPTSPAPTSSLPSHPPKGCEGEEGGSHSQADTGSLTTLASFFSGQSSHKAVDSEILESLGMERLTWLGRVTSVRVVVESLKVDLGQLEALLLLQKKRKVTQSTPDVPSRYMCM